MLAASQAGTAGVLTRASWSMRLRALLGLLLAAPLGMKQLPLKSTPLVSTDLSQKTPNSLNSLPTISTESSQIAQVTATSRPVPGIILFAFRPPLSLVLT